MAQGSRIQLIPHTEKERGLRSKGGLRRQETVMRMSCNLTHAYAQPPLPPNQNALSYLDKLVSMVVIPEAAVQRWLAAKVVRCRYVKVVQEAQQVFSACWHKRTFGSLFYAALRDGLDVITGGVDGDGETKGETERFREKGIVILFCTSCYCLASGVYKNVIKTSLNSLQKLSHI